MILINLLPHREEKRRQRKQAFFVGLGVAAGLGLLLAGVWFSVINQLTAAQVSRNDFLKSQIGMLESQIKDIAQLQAEIESLKARQRAVEDLQTNRNVPVYLLDELVKQTPEGVYLTTIKQLDNVVTVNGVAQTNERVSEFLRNTLNNSKWLERPELVEIKAMTVQTTNKEQRRLFDFSMRVSLKRPEVAAQAASGAASGALPVKPPASAPTTTPAKSV
ncbi:Tfp pilus assembly protein PilN [Burkholderiales bacterium JOSHI_001]|nr:Tfp pilus assembly protein PilN [Burkholderiales bacterium JOSHI_001]